MHAPSFGFLSIKYKSGFCTSEIFLESDTGRTGKKISCTSLSHSAQHSYLTKKSKNDFDLASMY
jgi:hypothetical protein